MSELLVGLLTQEERVDDTEPLRRLAASVVLRAWADLYAPGVLPAERERARMWIEDDAEYPDTDGGGLSFRTCCRALGYVHWQLRDQLLGSAGRRVYELTRGRLPWARS